MTIPEDQTLTTEDLKKLRDYFLGSDPIIRPHIVASWRESVKILIRYRKWFKKGSSIYIFPVAEMDRFKRKVGGK